MHVHVHLLLRVKPQSAKPLSAKLDSPPSLRQWCSVAPVARFFFLIYSIYMYINALSSP